LYNHKFESPLKEKSDQQANVLHVKLRLASQLPLAAHAFACLPGHKVFV
jgi:hypothetical protein